MPPAPSPAASTAGPSDCVYTFTPAVETEALTYVTPSATVTAPGGGRLEYPAALPVQPLTATAASSAGEVDARRAYAAFLAQPTARAGLPQYGTALTPYQDSVERLNVPPGRYVRYAANQVVTSSFVRSCPGPAAGRDAVGTVTSFWPDFPLGGTVNCADPQGAAQQQAARLMCTPGS
ncbi:hypothetical protein HUT16_33800 [Kitasatospora sp. NA04385]|uniref:hypothetical protein n=1 Tax=Kitasatospora sp. NA04385 TaxID=2742135 RepID=UPI0015926DFD|nr:hypothetical protein [Kitasatospora sp. NA04385]QKW23400.1 hypothetical protein HUT16_33800 [Kitasatospora sp. NA04385]